jgi:hypothetical protein
MEVKKRSKKYMAEEKVVSREEFDSLKKEMSNSFSQIINLIKEKPKTEAESKKVEAKKAVDKTAEANDAYLEPVHPDWIADAKLKIGESLERCEVDYPKNGTPRYTVVIKNDHSNASSSHLQFYKIDRRTVAVINGFETVKAFNSLVAQNLKLNPKKLD